MPEKISILKESGEILNSNIVSIFSIPETEKKYIITTENAVDPHGLTVFHVSEIVGDELIKVVTDEEWSTIKTIMRSIISGNAGPYQYQPSLEKASVKGQYSRDISVSASAAKQMSDNYVSAIKAMKGTNIGENSVPSSTSIFPANTTPAEENEVIPGIAEVTSTNGSGNVTSSMSSIPSEEANGEEGSNGSGLKLNPISEVQNITQVPPLNSSVVGSSIPQTEVKAIEENINEVSPVVVADENPVEDLAKKDLKISPVEAVNVEVQPSNGIPSSSSNTQIMPSSNTGNNFSFNLGDIRGAKSIEEIVNITTNAFRESIQNILQVVANMNSSTAEKEARLNEREELITQREKMINEQLMSMMNNFSSMQQLNSSQKDSSTNSN